MRTPNILTIAGSDSGGGAGIQADLKTIMALDGYGMSVITALTAQNGLGVTGIHAPEPEFVVLQLRAVLDGFPVHAAKTGMLFSAGIINALADALRDRSFPLVVDPVSVSQSGSRLLREDAVEALKERMIPGCDLLTPNRPEAEMLTGMTISCADDAAAAGEALHAPDLDGVRARALDVRAHGVEEVGKVNDVRLARRILDHGAAARKRCRDDDIHRRADRDLIQIYLCPVQAAVRRIGIDKAVFHLDVRAHRGHALDVLVDRPDAEIAAAGHGRLGRAEAAEHRADEVVRRADLAHQVIRRLGEAHLGAVDLDGGGAEVFHPRAQPLQDLQEHIHVADLGHILDPADTVDHQRCRNDRHCRVFRAADLDLPVQGSAAMYYISIQTI